MRVAKIIDEQILNRFPGKSKKMSVLNNVKIDKIVFTNNFAKAKIFFDELYLKESHNIESFLKSRNRLSINFKDGSKVRWMNLNEAHRGYRCNNAVIDRDIDRDSLNMIVIPICVYCGKDTIELF